MEAEADEEAAQEADEEDAKTPTQGKKNTLTSKTTQAAKPPSAAEKRAMLGGTAKNLTHSASHAEGWRG